MELFFIYKQCFLCQHTIITTHLLSDFSDVWSSNKGHQNTFFKFFKKIFCSRSDFLKYIKICLEKNTTGNEGKPFLLQ